MNIESIRTLVVRWQLWWRESRVYRDFVKHPDYTKLARLLRFVVQNERRFPIEFGEAREALAALDWKKCSQEIGPVHREIVFQAFGSYLFRDPHKTSRSDWQLWIKMSRLDGRVLPVAEPAFAQGLLDAKRRAKLDDLPKEDSDYLLSCYLKAYGEILEASGVADRDLVLPILLEFAAIARILGPTEYSSTILQRWVKSGQQRPRALANFSNNDAYDAPIRGVGSPNGASLTMYQGGHLGTPVRIAYAGITGDRSLNSQMFTSLFATALACDQDRSFLTASGGIIYLTEGPRSISSGHGETVLRGVLGPTGPVEPRKGVPSLGMDAEEAFALVSELFQRFRNSTGLVSVMHWEVADAEELLRRITETLSGTEPTSKRFKSEPGHSESAGIIHIMSILHRTANNRVEPLQIPISYSSLNPDLVLRLIRTTRQSYMVQLIANGRRREAMAKDAYNQQDRFVKQWQSLTPEQKEAKCAADPYVIITQSYNFELGVIIAVDPPEKITRREYEDKRRPDLCDSAKQYSEKFAALCATLEKLNQTGGTADVLSFRFLIDAAIRRDSLLIGDSAFQSAYKNWVDHTAAPVWALIEDWAIRHNYPVELLAADNVVFNSRVTEDEQTVLIQPHVMIDLHDFEIVIDGKNGTMYALPGGHTPTLRERIIPDLGLNIIDPATLHQQFCTWVGNHLKLTDSPSSSHGGLIKSIASEKKIAGILFLYEGKRLLFKGEVNRSVEILNKARKFDLAPIYFWGAVACQYRFLHGYGNDLLGDSNLDVVGKRDRLLQISLHILIESLKPISPKLSQKEFEARLKAAGLFDVLSPMDQDYMDLMQQMLAGSLTRSLPVDAEAKSMLGQASARDRQFTNGLMQDKADLVALEQSSLNLTADEERRLQAAVHGMSALDFLSLAETMKTVAKTMPFTGRPSRELKTQLEAIVKRAQTLPLLDLPGQNQIEELEGILGQA